MTFRDVCFGLFGGAILAAVVYYGRTQMAKFDDIQAALDEIGTDLDALIALVQSGNPDGLTAEQTAEVLARVSALKDKFTPPAPTT